MQSQRQGACASCATVPPWSVEVAVGVVQSHVDGNVTSEFAGGSADAPRTNVLLLLLFPSSFLVLRLPKHTTANTRRDVGVWNKRVTPTPTFVLTAQEVGVLAGQLRASGFETEEDLLVAAREVLHTTLTLLSTQRNISYKRCRLLSPYS